LINAVDRYDPRRQVPFADPSILGVLKRHFRDTTWAMRVPSPIQELARRMPDAGVDDRLSIQPHLAHLPVRERRIRIPRFDDHMTQTRIAAEIGIADARVPAVEAVPGPTTHRRAGLRVQTHAGPAAAAVTDLSGLAACRQGRSGG